MKFSILKFSFIVLFCLSSIYFFQPLIVSPNLLDRIYYVVFFVLLFFTIIGYRGSENHAFSTPILLLITAILISAFSAAFFWHQDLLYSFLGISIYLGYCLFFLLISWRQNVQEIEGIIILMGVLYIIAYAISFYFYPLLLFGSEGSFDRGFQTIHLPGMGFLFLFSFYSLSQLYKKRKYWWLIIYIITLVFITMRLTRTLIACSFILSAVYIMRKSSYFNKVIAALFIVGFIYMVTQMNFFKLLVGETKSQTENISDDIRVQSALFYMNDFSPNTFTRIFGNGEPAGGSNYSRYNYYVKQELGFYQSDIGYLGLYSKFGVLAILAFLILLYRTYRISIADEYLYCKYFIYFILLTNLIIDASFNASFIPSIALALYILYVKDLSKSVKSEEAVERLDRET